MASSVLLFSKFTSVSLSPFSTDHSIVTACPEVFGSCNISKLSQPRAFVCVVEITIVNLLEMHTRSRNPA